MLRVLLLVLFATLIYAVQFQVVPEKVDGTPTKYFLSVDSPTVYINGRSKLVTDGSTIYAEFDWSNVELSAQFTGTSISATFKDPTGNRYDAYIDSKLVTVINTTQTETNYLIADKLTDSEHSALLVKRTEALFGIAKFYGFDVTSAYSQPKNSPKVSSRRIEFIGDSISCGYGDLGTPPCPFSAETQDASRAYGSLVAKALDADLYLECWSGKGMVRNYGDPNITSLYPFPSYYPRTLANDPSTLWSFKSWIPQAVVINLGTNDYSTQPIPPQAIYSNAYNSFIANLQDKYGSGVQIFAVCGPLIGNPCCEYVQDIVNQHKSAGVYYVNMQNILNSDDYGCAGHPGIKGHEKMAAITIPIIKKVMGW